MALIKRKSVLRFSVVKMVVVKTCQTGSHCCTCVSILHQTFSLPYTISGENLPFLEENLPFQSSML